MKKKINSFLAKHGKVTVITTCGLVVVALFSIWLGFSLSEGWDWIIKWLTSKWAIYVYIALGAFVIFTLWITHYIKNLGDK